MRHEPEKILEGLHNRQTRAIARAISLVEDNDDAAAFLLSSLDKPSFDRALVLGITGSPGVGKSTLTSGLIRHYRSLGKRVGIIAVDPSSPISGGALLGDRVRMMGHALDPDVVVRSMATRGRLGGLCAAAGAAVRIMAAAGCSPIIIETVGVGQSEMDIVRLADVTIMVLAPGMGDSIQAMKAGILEVADLLVINKADCRGAETLVMDMEAALRDQNDAWTSRVVSTVATEEKGIDELALAIAGFDVHLREAAIRAKRREASRRKEIVDWVLEMIKPRLTEELTKSDSLPDEPRAAAKILAEKMFTEKQSE
ncbi:MAG: hypothetical protein BM485_14830 [Desulfobulbaceae bacterium DB1]|nr:MAG: hypothetical protein BM485_14830 [Desulfobulbaceae bacterium DB1]